MRVERVFLWCSRRQREEERRGRLPYHTPSVIKLVIDCKRTIALMKRFIRCVCVCVCVSVSLSVCVCVCFWRVWLFVHDNMFVECRI